MVKKVYKLYDYEYWYDFSTRCWFAAIFNEGCQISDTMDAYKKETILQYIENDKKRRDEVMEKAFN